jgi:predicted molibdopterin-dependent oxidoreductase YjgC
MWVVSMKEGYRVTEALTDAIMPSASTYESSGALTGERRRGNRVRRLMALGRLQTRGRRRERVEYHQQMPDWEINRQRLS